MPVHPDRVDAGVVTRAMVGHHFQPHGTDRPLALPSHHREGLTRACASAVAAVVLEATEQSPCRVCLVNVSPDAKFLWGRSHVGRYGIVAVFQGHSVYNDGGAYTPSTGSTRCQYAHVMKT